MPDIAGITGPDWADVEVQEEQEPTLLPCRYCSQSYLTEAERDECCRFECGQCGGEHRYQEDADDCCTWRCPNCGESHESEREADACCRQGGDPWYPTPPSNLTPYSLQIDPAPSREPRQLSIEQELTGGGGAVASLLYDLGLSSHGGIESYSYQPGIAGIAVCEDGSLPSDGGEVKYSRFLLSERGYADKLSQALGYVRWLHKEAGVVKVGSSAGMHIHVAAKDVNGKVLGPVQMAALHELFSFGEDMIYGLASAGWRSHRYDGTGNDYAKPIPKLSTRDKNPWHVARIMGSKYYGINFERLLETVNTCRCGSVRFGAWSECECGAFDGATCEWRVFNTSTMPETIHAWLLFVLGVTARAEYHSVGTLPNQEFDPYNAKGVARRQGRKETLDWFLKSCPFTRDEQDVIRAAAERSPLIGEEV